MDRYLGGEEIDVDILVDDLEKAVARGSFYPVLPVCPVPAGSAWPSCSRCSPAAFPSPLEHPLPAVTTASGDPRAAPDLRPGRAAGGRGRQDHDRPVRRAGLPGPGLLRHAAPGDRRARLRPRHGRPRPRRPRRRRAGRAPVSPAGQGAATESPKCVAGDICAITKLGQRRDRRHALGQGRPAADRAVGDARAAAAGRDRRAKTKSDEDALAKNLARLVAGDPTLRLERNPETHQLVLWCMGEAHADVVLDRLRTATASRSTPSRCGCRCGRPSPRPAKGHGRHVKQSGGHGQYAVCDIEVEPLPRGAGFEFVDKVVGGAVPRQYIPSVEKGVRAQMERGVVAGLPGRRPPGHARRRQGALGRLLRHGLPDRRLRWR